MIFKEIYGQEQALNLLNHDIKSANVTHAYLFHGPMGVGKTETALKFAKAIGCQNGGCLKCEVCKGFKRKLHPDFFFIHPMGKFITINQVRELEHWATFKSSQAAMKVAVLKTVENFTEEAANAILKTLEEPLENVIFIATTSNREAVLSTIISRCRQVRFKAVPLKELIEYLEERGCRSKKAELTARLSQGIFGKALNLANNKSLWQLRDESLKNLKKMLVADPDEISFLTESLITVINQFLDKEIKTKDNTLEIQNPKISKLLKKQAKRQKTAKTQESYCLVLDFWWLWLRDLVVYEANGERESLLNIDYFDEIANHCQNSKVSKFWYLVQRIPNVKELIKQNVNPQLAIEEMFLRAAQIN